jgi:N-methylhydantoinase B
MTTPIDPISLEVLRNKLDSIADEMELTLLKSSHSAIVKEALDASAALFDPTGQQIAQAAAAPIHLGMIIPAVRKFVELFPPSTMREGDVYVLNDPFQGGTHLPDLVMSMPIFYEGAVVAIATAISHQQDFGGRSPGSTPVDATEIFQEGLRIPPMKFQDAGVPNATLIAIIERNVRIPDVVIGDIHGQLAACHVAKTRLHELLGRLGAAAFAAGLEELLNRAEQLTRQAIERIPDGKYSFVDYLDNDGVSLDRRVRIAVAVTVSGSEVLVDFTGTDPQVSGPINCVPASTLSAVYYVVKVAIDPDIPNNAGCYRAVQVHMPEGTIVNARSPAAVNARAVVVRRTVDCLLGALNRAIPERLPAASSGHPLVMSIGGIDPRDGHPYVTAEIGTGGMGARPTKDGVDSIQTDTSNAQDIPAEAIELEFPIRIGFWRLRPDSGGVGRFRGGVGFEKRFEVLRGAARISHRGERHLTAPWGLFGGGAGAQSRSLLRRADGSEVQIPSKMEFVMYPGDVLDVWTSGGGGHGDPLERETELVHADLLDGKVSASAGEKAYGVVLRGEAVDPHATRSRRIALADARGPISWRYDRGPLGRE